MKLLRPQILRYLKEFDHLETYERGSYIKKVDDTAIEFALEIRSANISKNESLARTLFDMPYNNNMYSVHEKFMTTLIFEFPNNVVKKWCKKSLLTNQRVCLLLESSDYQYPPGIPLAPALEHGLFYQRQYYDLIDRDKFLKVKSKVLKNIGPMEYIFKESNLKLIEKRSIIDIFEKASSKKCGETDIRKISKVFTKEAYAQISFTKSNKPRVDDLNKLLCPREFKSEEYIPKVTDRANVDELFQFAKDLGFIDSENNLIKGYTSADDKRIRNVIEDRIIRVYDYTALKLVMLQLCAFAKLGYESIPSELFISQVLSIGLNTLDLDQFDVIDSVRDLLWLNEDWPMSFSVYNGYIRIDKKMAKAFPDSMYVTDKSKILREGIQGLIQLTNQPANEYDIVRDEFPWFF